MSSYGWFTLLVVGVAVERLVELVVARRNLAWAVARGGVEHGRALFGWMVLLHVGLLGGSLVEVWTQRPPWLPWLGWPMLGLVVASQGLRWWCISSLGRQWNTRVVVVPGLPLVTRGPYRRWRHPNYVAVVIEGFALPLVHTAWITSALFSALDAVVLRSRIRTEDRALAQLRPSADRDR